MLIVEDRAEIATRLSDAVAQSEELQIAGTVSTLGHGLELLIELQLRVVFVDLGLPDGSGGNHPACRTGNLGL